MLLLRTPHPVQDASALLANRRIVCDCRGHCGPFINESYYAAFPGWEGYGDCVVCGSTVQTGRRRPAN